MLNLTNSPREMRDQRHERETQKTQVGSAAISFRNPESAQPVAAHAAAGEADATRMAIHHHPAISGYCVECGHETTSIVKSTPTKAEFLCPPCGRAIREAI